jgi:chlorobactene glucosyltransferase
MVMQLVLLLLAIFILIISLYNFFTAPRLENLNSTQKDLPLVSILIPARNEQDNISRCLDKIFSLKYQNKQVIVYDDQSTDLTAKVLNDYKARQNELNIIKGQDKPKDWTGKSWACYNLYKASKGDMLLFIDSDVLVSESCLDDMIHFFLNSDIALLSCFPRQIIKSFGEWLVVPLMNWILLSLLPLKLVYSSNHPSLSAANGQFMLFKRKDYEDIKGHEAVKMALVEDVAFCVKLKKAGKKVMTTITQTAVWCRMYHGLKESIGGFTKNFFPGFNMPKSVFILFILTLFYIFFVPFVLVFYNIDYLVNIAVILLIRAVISFSSGQNVLANLLLHPFQMISMMIVGVSSITAFSKGRISWKGRRI